MNVITSELIDTCTPDQLRDVARLSAELHLGMSSGGMLTWAALGNSDPATYNGYHPADNDDLGRCEKLFAAAPAWLVTNMSILMDEFRAEVTARNAEVAAERHEREARQAELEADRRAALAARVSQAVDLHLDGRQASILAYIVGDWYDADPDETGAPFSMEDVNALMGLLRSSAPPLTV